MQTKVANLILKFYIRLLPFMAMLQGSGGGGGGGGEGGN